MMDYDQSSLKVKYKYSKYKGDESENILTVNIDYRRVESLLSDINTISKQNNLKLLRKYIMAYELLNNHIASSVEIKEIK